MDIRDIEVSLLSINPVPDRTQLFKHAIRHYRGGEVGVSLRTWLTPDAAKSTVTLSAEVVYTDRDKLMHPILLTYCVSGEFAVSQMSDCMAVSTGSLFLPHHLLTLMLGTVIGAMRGMISLTTAGTPLGNYPLPLLNVADLALSLTRTPAARPA